MSSSNTSVRDTVIADAKSLPDLLQKASVLDPTLAAALNAKAVGASLTPLGGVVGMIISGVVSHYGLGWSDDVTKIIAGSFVVIGGYLTHWVQQKLAKPVLAPPA